jgi:predicted HAD superfamily Cof-like phosphohydrolase
VQAKSDTLILRPVNLVDAYDAVLDLLVVVIGAGIAMGTELEPGWQEVHRSNMEKFKGGRKRADGKWLKPERWQPPNLTAILAALAAAAEEHDRQKALEFDVLRTAELPE